MYLEANIGDFPVVGGLGPRSRHTSRDEAAALQARIGRAKAAYTTRRVDLEGVEHIVDDVTPRMGDVVLARVARVGHHTRIELATGRRATMHPGDEVIVCYGARYAPDQFEAYVPDDLGSCSLVAGGGIAARCESRHERMKRPTRLEPVGILADADRARLNLDRFAIRPVARCADVPVIAVLGTAMNSGKTTTGAALVRGLAGQGRRVAAAKVTGTGAGGDRWTMQDAGACAVLDFTDAGVPSTFGVAPDQIERIFVRLVDELAASEPDAIVVEVADGLLHGETAALVASTVFRETVNDIVFAAGDALGASAGAEHLSRLGLRVRLISGLLTRSPLAMREAQQATGLSVVSAEQIVNGAGVALIDCPVADAA